MKQQTTDWLLKAVAQQVRRPTADLAVGPAIPSGQALHVVPVSCAASEQDWIAKKIHPALTREIHAYKNVLAGKDWAATLEGMFQDPERGRWLVLKHAGGQLSRPQAVAHMAPLAALITAMHTEGRVGWWPSIPWPRPLHVRYGYRYFRGEVSRALAALQQTAEQLNIPVDELPRASEAETVLQEAVSSMRPCKPGFIHGDLSFRNIVGRDGEYRVVDFSQWGSGPWLWDVACLTIDFSPAERRRFLARYLRERKVRKHPVEGKGWDHAVENVRALRVLLGWGALAGYLSDKPQERERWFGARRRQWMEIVG